jgi:formylglycine-generating enzyme required for sulfatase activity
MLAMTVIAAQYGCHSPGPTTASPSATLFGRDALAMLLSEGNYVKIKPGSFLMGAAPDESAAGADERPQHRVTITREFEIGRTEVTQKQWQAVMGSNPSVFKGPDLPVINISWNDVQDFLKTLQAVDEKHLYRMPTEAEWEYACRAGSAGPYAGEEAMPVASNTRANRKALKEFAARRQERQNAMIEQLKESAWFEASSQNRPHAVAMRKPNAWGLHDMHGNVWEWSADWYDRRAYGKNPVDDPKGPAEGQSKVQRGGSWQSPADACRAARRNSALPVERNHLTGFRLVRVKK